MILDKCKNCKHYRPYQMKKKSFFSNKVKTKNCSQGNCIARKLNIGIYRTIEDNGWCEKYERKNEKKNNKNYVYNYTCPNCNDILSEVENCNYCPECGTRLDWSRNE